MRHSTKVVPSSNALSLLNVALTKEHASPLEPVPPRSMFAVEDFEDVAPFISIAFLMLVVGVWLHGRLGNGKQSKPLGTTQEKGSDRALTWLSMLAAASAVLLVFQLVLGLLSGSLTLLADMAHAAGDTVTYLAAYCAERVKRDLAWRGMASSTVSRLDTAAGTMSTLLVAGVSMSAMLDAVHRLRSPRPDQHGEAIGLIGPAILTFAIVSLAANIGLLVVRFKTQADEGTGRIDPELSVETVPMPLPRVEAVPPPPPPFEAVPPPPPPFETTDAVPPPPPPVAAFAAPSRPRRQRRQQQRLQPEQQQQAGPQLQQQPQPPSTTVKWLHAVFHPGCDDAGCPDHAPAQADNEKGEGLVAVDDKESRIQKEKNFNLFGATLHLATDVVRSLLVLLAGLLLEGGILQDVARTDAVCALVVGTCVLLGSAAFFCGPPLTH